MPTVHRVINGHPTKSRMSIPFFYEPAFETVVQPLPGLFMQPGLKPGLGCDVTAQARFSPVRYGTHLEGKILRNFEALEL